MRKLMRLGMIAMTAATLWMGLAASAGAQQETGSAADVAAADAAVVEQAYLNVVRHYNPNLVDYEAQLITRSILYYSSMYSIDPRLVVALIVVESRFKPNAVSRKGAMGLGQLMPGTARGLGVANPFDIQQNVYGTVRYLRAQYDRFSFVDERALDFMLAAYNAGPQAVARYNGVPPYRETRSYVEKVKRLYRYFVYGT